MTTTTDSSPLHSGAGVDASSTTAQAQRAVKVFRAMQPGLTSFARVLTGRREVRVQLATGGPRTDGTKIMYRPPIALGSGARHERSACDQRDEATGVQRCPACAVREEVMIQIYHEISHIAFGSFQKIEDRDKAELVARALEEYPSRYAEKIKERIADLNDSSIYKDYMNMSQVISPYLPPLLNALEDVRIDNAMFRARKGTKKMFDAMTTQIFAAGMEQDDGTSVQWRDQPPNAQITVGVFCLGSEYDYAGWFSEEVEEALNDATLQQLVADCVGSGTNAELYRKSFPILARIRELGFLLNPEDEEDEDGPGDPDDMDDSSGDSDDASDPSGESSEDSEEDNSQEEEELDEDDAGPGEASPESDEDEDASESGRGDSDEPSDEDDSETDQSSGSSDSEESEESEQGESDPEDDDFDDDGEGSEAGDQDAEPESDEDQSSGSEGQGGTAPSDSDEQSEEVDEESDPSGDDPQESGGSGQGSGDRERDVPDGGVEDEPDYSEETRDDSDEDGSQSDADEPGEDDEYSTDADDEELIDSGADEGKGGAHTEQEPQGTPTDVSKSVEVFGHHGEIHDFDDHSSHEGESSDSAEEQSAVDTAIIQGLYFETPSIHIDDVKIFRYGEEIPDDMYAERWYAWRYSGDGEQDLNEFEKANLRRNGQMVDIEIPEAILGPATLESRRAFNDNQRAIHERNLRAGKIRNGALGKRAWSGDERLFQKSNMPGKKSYSVLIGIDISMSTIGENIALSKRAAYAQAELCSRLGIDFAIWAHSTGGYSGTGSQGQDTFTMDMYEIKSFDEEWTPDIKYRLESIAPVAGNLDGHSIEFYRKLVEQRATTDKIIMYYTDGKMPAANHDEELEVLQREIRYCKSRGITLMGVGIRTDSPKSHGLDTCEVNTDEDLVGVVRHLSKRLDMHR